MLTEYEAAMLVKQRNAEAERPLAAAPSSRNRIGTVLLALSLLSAVGLLCVALSDRGPAARATRADSAGTIATPANLVIHPAASGLPEALPFLRERPLANEDHLPDVIAAAAGIGGSIQ